MIRQRVPMLDAATLDDRTRPALDDASLLATRLRIFAWPSRSAGVDVRRSRQVGSIDAWRLDRQA